MVKKMKIQISKTPLAAARMNMEQFERELRLSFDIEKAFNISTTITTNDLLDTNDEVKRMMFLSIDWGQILKLYKVKEQDEMRIYLNKIKFENKLVLTPSSADMDTFTFECTESIEDREDYFISHSFIPMIEHHIEKHLADTIFDYTEKTWKMV